jgi:hypothetical protein
VTRQSDAFATVRKPIPIGDILGLIGDRKAVGTFSALGRFSVPPKGCYVYFLIWQGHIVYIGQTTNLLARIGSHQNSKKRFSDVWFIRVRKSEREAIEKALIGRVSPSQNKAWNGQKALRTYRLVKPLATECGGAE